MTRHHYVDQGSSCAVREKFFGDPIVSFLYSHVREDAGWLFKALTSSRLTELLGALHFDVRPASPERMRRRLAKNLGIAFEECVDPPETLDTPRKVFERRIRYWACRPMAPDPTAISSPADARILVGSFLRTSHLYLKDKFFRYEEMFGKGKLAWYDAFQGGDFAVLRLTPDKYHFNHLPVTGLVRDVYEIDGVYQSCHPAVIIAQATPHSKNRRTVTIIDTDVPNGTQAGLVAMIEVVALMIGDIVQCYSANHYDAPAPLHVGMKVERGCPKSLFRPGSSTVVLIFQKERVQFRPDILANLRRATLSSLYSKAWGDAWVETDVPVRATIARAIQGGTL
ncbi:MAG: phosphatidylserine decarboxylase [bacterium]